ncbi:MAG: cyclic nucleotide-binding domain-containing protein [Deltaproteobacteria bacterium]|nr:cyclic nucleotide-binding domain-containing protein [Deltaproteobacteria bacterium]
MKTFDWANLLLRHPIFSSLDDKEVQWLLQDEVSVEKQYRPSAPIVQEGDVGDSIFLIGSGSVRVVLLEKDAHEVTLSILKKGEFFGEIALLEQRPRSATVMAKENCTLLELRGQEFLKLLDEHPDIGFKVLLILSERLRHVRDQGLAVDLKGVDEKLKLFNTKLDAELKAVEASLKAAQTVFDQTKLRTDEIINSTDRSRARQTWFFGIVATLVTIATAFGIQEVIDVKRYAEQAETAMQNITAAESTLEKIGPSIERVSRINESFDRLASLLLQPKFQKALDTGTEEDINNSYTELKDYHISLEYFLTDVEFAILIRPKRDYTNILRRILTDAEEPKERIWAYYLLLTSAILADNTKTFKEQLPAFKTYAEKRGPFQYDLSALESHFAQVEPTTRQEMFNQVLELIPRRSRQEELSSSDIGHPTRHVPAV